MENYYASRSVTLIHELKRLGLAQEMFALLHDGNNKSMEAHLTYCLRTGIFSNSPPTNINVQRRLEFLWKNHAEFVQDFGPHKIWRALADAAMILIPAKTQI